MGPKDKRPYKKDARKSGSEKEIWRSDVGPWINKYEKSLEDGKSKTKGFFPRASRKNMALLIPWDWFQTSDIQN